MTPRLRMLAGLNGSDVQFWVNDPISYSDLHKDTLHNQSPYRSGRNIRHCDCARLHSSG